MYTVRDLKKLNYTLFLEYAFLVVMALMIVFYFLSNTMFEVQWPGKFLLYLRNVMTVVVFFRIATKKEYDFKKIAFMGLILLVFYVSYINDASDSEIVDIILLIIGAYDIGINKIAKTYFGTTLVLLSVTVVSSLTGFIVNLAYTEDEGGHVRYCLGTTHHFWITAYVFYLTCAYLIIRRDKIRYSELLILELISVLFFIFCHGRNHFFCTTIMLGLISVAKYRSECNKISITDMILSCVTPILCSACSILSIVFFAGEFPLLGALNKLCNNRLSMCKLGYDALGFSLWGKKIVTYGSSKYGTHYSQSNNGFVIDSGYIYMAIKYGIIVLTVFLLLLLWMNYNACLNNQKILLIILCINMVQFIIDRDMFFVNCNFLIWCTFASLQDENGKNPNNVPPSDGTTIA